MVKQFSMQRVYPFAHVLELLGRLSLLFRVIMSTQEFSLGGGFTEYKVHRQRL